MSNLWMTDEGRAPAGVVAQVIFAVRLLLSFFHGSGARSSDLTEGVILARPQPAMTTLGEDGVDSPLGEGFYVDGAGDGEAEVPTIRNSTSIIMLQTIRRLEEAVKEMKQNHAITEKAFLKKIEQMEEEKRKQFVEQEKMRMKVDELEQKV